MDETYSLFRFDISTRWFLGSLLMNERSGGGGGGVKDGNKKK
ncbi:hypothetical protein PP707_06300 [Acetobacter pasteurianus]|nr:hypothetical protein [Acetobacter pasteurianus]